MIAYEEMLDRDFAWALREGSMHFERDSAVHKALVKITRRLEELGIPYAVVGGMALLYHGYRRFTEDVDFAGLSRGAQEMIKLIPLAREFGDQLNPFVRSKFYELWESTRHQPDA